MDGTEDDALYEDFLGEGVAETEDVADNDGYADYYDDFPATHEILEYNQFFRSWWEWFWFWGILIILIDRKNWQANTSDVDMVDICQRKTFQGQKWPRLIY